MSEIFWNARKDFIGLSTDTKETTNMVNGNTFYEVDTSAFFIFYNGTWYEQGVEETSSNTEVIENGTE